VDRRWRGLLKKHRRRSTEAPGKEEGDGAQSISGSSLRRCSTVEGGARGGRQRASAVQQLHEGQGGGEAQRNLEVRWTKVVLTVKEEVAAVDWQNPAPNNALRWLEQMRHRRGEVGMLWGALERRRTKGGAKTASEG
jgi:hypothetical protein